MGLLGDFFLGKANFGSAFMLELKQALLILLKLVLGNRLVGPVSVYTFRTSSEEEVRDFCVSPLGVPEPCRLAERSPV